MTISCPKRCAEFDQDFSVNAGQKQILSRMSGRARPGEAQMDGDLFSRWGWNPQETAGGIYHDELHDFFTSKN